MKNSRQVKREREQARTLSGRELVQVTGGEGTPMPAAKRPLPDDGTPLPS